MRTPTPIKEIFFTAVLIALTILAQVTASAQSKKQADAPRGPVIRTRPTGQPLGSNPSLFQPAKTYNTGGNLSYSVAVADVNGDHKPDLVVASNGTIGVLLGNGDGTFKRVVTYLAGGQSAPKTSVAIADLNKDGNADIVVVNSASGNYGVLLGNGDGTFQPAATNFLCGGGGGWPGAVAVADVNGDGNPDLFVDNAACNSSVGVLLGNGDGTFIGRGSYYWSGDLGDDSIASADLNDDGRPDVVVANGCCNVSSSLGVLLGNGDGTLQTVSVYDPGGLYPSSVVVADVNGDGKADLVVANSCASANHCTGEGSVAVLLGNGNGTFLPAVAYDSGGWGSSGVAAADVTGEGRVDLLVANGLSNTVGLLQGNGDGTFRPVATYGSGGIQPTSIAIADLNGDGKPDVIVTNQCGDPNCGFGSVSVLLQNNTSTLLVSSLNPSTYGQKVTWTATVTSSVSVMPTGTVKFIWSGHTVGSAILNTNGVATLSRSNLNADPYPLTAVYSGDSANLGSTSAVLNQVVLQTTSSATLTSSPNPSIQGQAVTFTATILSPTVIPTGPVTFTAGKTVLGTAQLSGGRARLTISSLAVGATKVTATYYGNSNIAKSSASVTQIVR